MDIFHTKTHGFATGGLHSCTDPCEAPFIMDACTLGDMFWTVSQKHPPTAMITLGIARNFFLYNSDWIPLKEESHIHLGCLEVESFSFLGELTL